MNEEQLNKILEETSQFLTDKGVSFICYVWNENANVCGGCHSLDADMGDVMVTITRLVEHFNLSPDALIAALNMAKLEMGEN